MDAFKCCCGLNSKKAAKSKAGRHRISYSYLTYCRLHSEGTQVVGSRPMLPVSGRHRVVATAVCLALGGTALLSWAFSIFTEDKSKKRPDNVPTLPPQTDAAGTSNLDSPDGGDVEHGAENRSTSNITAELLAGQGLEGPSLVIENTAALEPSKKDGTHPSPWYNRYSEDQPLTAADIRVTALPLTEEGVAGQPVNFFGKVPTFDERYTSSLVKTPIADAIASGQIDVVVREKSPKQPGEIEQRISQLDTKVTTYEVGKPVTQEMVSEGDGSAISSIPLSVSSKSLEKGATYSPGHKTNTVPLSGVDNSVAELNEAVGAVMDMKSDINPKELTYNRSASLSSESSKGMSHTPPTVKADRNFVNERDSNDQPNSLDKSDQGSSLSGLDNSLHIVEEGDMTGSQQELDAGAPTEAAIESDVRVKENSDEIVETILQPSNAPIADTEAFDDNSFDVNDNIALEIKNKSDELLPETVGDEQHDIQVSPAVSTGNVHFTEFYAPARMVRELTPDSLLLDSLHGSPEHPSKSVERSEMKFQIGVDKRISSSLDSSPQTPSRSCDSPLDKPDMASNNSLSDSQSTSSMEKSEYYAPPKIERELTAEISSHTASASRLNGPDSHMRSEMHFQLGGKKESNKTAISTAETGKRQQPLDILKRVEITVNADDSSMNTPDSDPSDNKFKAAIDDSSEHTAPPGQSHDKGERSQGDGAEIDITVPLDTLDIKSHDSSSIHSRSSSSSSSRSRSKTDASSNDSNDEDKNRNTSTNDDTTKEMDVPNVKISESSSNQSNESISANAELSNDIKPEEAKILNAQVVITEAAPELLPEDKRNENGDTDHLTVGDEVGDETSSISSEGLEYSRKQVTETEEMIETSVEETVTMVITGVVSNPGSDDEIVLSMQDAVSQGLLDLANGLYHNQTTGENMSLIEAMNTGYIKMGPKKVEKSEETVKSVGIITIRTMRETTPYTIKTAKDTRNGQMYHVFQATRRKILDSEKGTFTDLKTGSKMLMGDAIDLGLVEVEYDTSAEGTFQEEITKTYSVHAVVDQKAKAKILFHDAVSRGLIDGETGEYIHNISNTRMPVEEAISRGFIKATIADNPEEISVDTMGNKVAEQGVEAIRKKVVAPLQALYQLKH